MKTIIKLALLSVLMVVMTTACEKADSDQSGLATNDAVTKGYKMSYSVDGVMYENVLMDESGYNALFVTLVELTNQGHVVTIHNSELYKALGMKDVETTETKDKTKIVAWTKEKTEGGYQVVVEKEEDTGTYKGTARK